MDTSYIIPSFLVLVMSLSVHEAAHAWTANRLGDPTARQLGRLTLNPLKHIDWIGTVLFPLLALYSNLPLIGWAKPVPVNWNNLRHPRRDFAIVAVAGPISNLLLAAGGAVVFTMLLSQQDSFGASSLTQRDIVLFNAISLNVLLAFFNMIPVPPLDGGNVLAGLVPESAARVLDSVRPYGIVILYGLMFMGVIGAIAYPIQEALIRWLL